MLSEVRNEILDPIADRFPELFPIGSRWYKPGMDDIFTVVAYETKEISPSWWSVLHPGSRFCVRSVKVLRDYSVGSLGINFDENGRASESEPSTGEYYWFDMGDFSRCLPIDAWMPIHREGEERQERIRRGEVSA